MIDIEDREYRAGKLLAEREAAIRQMINAGATSPLGLAAINEHFERRLEALICELSAELGNADAIYRVYNGGYNE